MTGFITITARRSVITGDWISLDPPARIHAGDQGWYQRLWAQVDEIDYRLRLAGAR